MLSKDDIEKYFVEIDRKLKERGKTGEIIIAGGATLALVYNARNSTKDIDALFRPSSEFREIIAEIAGEYNLEDDWLNDGVKGFFTENMRADLYKDYGNLSVYNVDAESLLALKLTSARYGSKDMDDSIVLMKHLNISTEKELFDIVEKHTSKNRHTMMSYYFTIEAFEKYQKEVALGKEASKTMEDNYPENNMNPSQQEAQKPKKPRSPKL